MKISHLLLVLPVALCYSLTTNKFEKIQSTDNVSHSEIKNKKITKKYINSSELNTYLNSHNYRTINLALVNGYTYTRYVLLDTEKRGEMYFLNLAIEHRPNLGSTTLSFDTISLVGMSYTAGFGFSTEAESPGVYCSYSSEMNLTSSSNVNMSYGASYILDEMEIGGTYYVYLENLLYDSIVVKRYNGSFISAEYYVNTPYNDKNFNSLSIVLSRARPNTQVSVLPSC